MKLFSRVISAFALAALALVVFSCTKTKSNVGTNSPTSGLMAVNLSTDKSIGINLSGSPLSNFPLTFSAYTGSYLNVLSGTWTVESFDYSAHSTMDTTNYTFASQKYYSLFVTGANGHYKNVLVRDNFDSLATGNAYVRYINAIPDSSGPTVTVTANGSNVVNGSAPFTAVSQFVAVTPGNTTIQVSNGGTINKTRTFPLVAQKAYTMLLVGTPGSNGSDSVQIRYIENGTFF